ncbi:neprilysin-4 [Bactrocera dorsalis]|uniref:Neprilysin-4 n=2 Tax=Endopterygota TaxID=33392 RepID=A0A6I9W6N1_BACDO|nr:neprilysin-4 [Bactrocera dorsalis]
MFRSSKNAECVIILSILLFLHLIGVDNAPASNATKEPMEGLDTEWAKQISQQAKAAEIHVMLNTKVDPCIDFYQYACGNWYRHHPAQLFNHLITDRFQLIASAFDRRLQLVLSEPRGDDVVETKLKDFYHACKLVEKDEVRYKVALQRIYQEFGKLPMLDGEDWKSEEFSWWESVAKIQHKYGKQIILAVDIMADIVNNTGNKVYIGPPDFSISSGIKILSTLQEITTVQHMKRFFGIEETKGTKITKELIDFERALVRGGSDSRKGLTLRDLVSLKSVGELREMYNESLDLEKFLQLALGAERVPDYIYIYDEKYLNSVVKIIAETPSHVVANYILWQMVQPYIVDVKKGNMAKWCVERTKKYFGKFVDYMVYQRYKDPDVEKEVYDMWNEVREVFRSELRGNKLDWIINSTRDYALQKLDAMNLYINSYESENFTAEYGDIQLTRNNYVENVQQILQIESRRKLQRQNGPVVPLEAPEVFTFTPVYNVLENNIKIPVALLQPRYFWGAHYPQALKYATLGYLIAHEMVHGFDDDGRNYDKLGNLRNWWDEKSTYQFEERRKCFQAQYHKYRYDGHQLRNDISQAENIADNAGVKLAYEAYQRWLNAQRSANVTGIERSETFSQLHFNNEQLFFIAFAQLWCDDVQSFFRTALAVSDSHAPGMYRVIGSLSNFQEFSWVFKCGQDAPMDPEFKCSLY